MNSLAIPFETLPQEEATQHSQQEIAQRLKFEQTSYDFLNGEELEDKILRIN